MVDRFEGAAALITAKGVQSVALECLQQRHHHGSERDTARTGFQGCATSVNARVQTRYLNKTQGGRLLYELLQVWAQRQSQSVPVTIFESAGRGSALWTGGTAVPT